MIAICCMMSFNIVANAGNDKPINVNELPAKAQTLLSGRGQAGGIRLTRNDNETEIAASEILSIRLKGISIQHILVEKAMTFENELFIGIHYDSERSEPCLIISTDGGQTLEAGHPFSTKNGKKQMIDPLLGLHPFVIRQACATLGIDPVKWKVIEQIGEKLWIIFTKYDATLTEINSLIIDDENRAFALDCKLIIDDNALYRQREFAGFIDPAMVSFAQTEARKFGHHLVRMDGEIAVVANGQGLASASIDALSSVGLKPALVLILDNNATISSVAAACQLIQDIPTVNAVFVNVFGSMIDCEQIAHGILKAKTIAETDIPYVIRLKGTHAEEASRKLKLAHNIQVINDLQIGMDFLTKNFDEHAVA